MIQGDFPAKEFLLRKLKASLSITNEIELLLFNEKIQEYVVIHNVDSVPNDSTIEIQEIISSNIQDPSSSSSPYFSPARASPSESTSNQELQEILRLKQELKEEKKRREEKELELDQAKQRIQELEGDLLKTLNPSQN